MNMKKVYISGPITGYDREYVSWAFAEAAERLETLGMKVVNPTRTLLFRWQWLYRIVGYKVTLLYDMWLLSRCDYIFMLPHWGLSGGARSEMIYADAVGVERYANEVIDAYIRTIFVAPMEGVNRGSVSQDQERTSAVREKEK
jgi:hypothetical protein